uniref:Uncharacterized protein n=1 Tax=Syphacia muris TaxID=451379 RepID=A0A0N5AH84_9BILA
QRGAAEACWAHNPEVGGSKPLAARWLEFAQHFSLLSEPSFILLNKYISNINY